MTPSSFSSSAWNPTASALAEAPAAAFGCAGGAVTWLVLNGSGWSTGSAASAGRESAATTAVRQRFLSFITGSFCGRKMLQEPASASAVVSGLRLCFRRNCGRGGRRDERRVACFVRASGLQVFVPVVVMLFRPGLVDHALAHRAVGAAHAERADVDMAEGGADEGECAAQVNDVGDRQHVARLVVDRQEQHGARADHEETERGDAQPEPQLLAGVEEPARGPAPLADEPTETGH